MSDRLADRRPDADRLDAVLRGMARPLAVAVSGGIDSLTLATLAHAVLPGTQMFHAVSPAVPGDATARVERLAAAARGWPLRVVDAGEFDDDAYTANPLNRCFFCKTNLYGSIARHTQAQMVSGANLDDLGEYRPGLDAARDHAVRHPYLEAGIDKPGVRRLARSLGLGDLSELPAAPCLSSRVETGIAIRADVLRAIHAVERDLARSFPRGIVRCRVRAKGVVVELDPASLADLDEPRRVAVAERAEGLFAGLVPVCALSFAPYRNGSAFLQEPGLMAEFKLDLSRRERIGLGEAIFCAGKSRDQIAAILESVQSHQEGFLLTRLDPVICESLPGPLRSQLDYDLVSRTAFFGRPQPRRTGPPVAIVMAGTSDVAMGREAARTLAFNGQPAEEFTDVGVAGLWRLLERIEAVRRAPVVIVGGRHGRGADQRRRRTGGGARDRAADLGRLRRGERRLDGAPFGIGQLRPGRAGGQYRQRLRRGLRGVADHEPRR